MTQHTTLSDTTAEELAEITSRAALAAEELAGTSLERRATLLEAAAAGIEAEKDELIVLAHEETNLPEAQLTGEVARTVNQLRLFAGVAREGGYLEAILDSADPSLTPPRPDVRRMLEPLGPVAVYSASNFPFAFSVAGGDTASALAAGCPVVVKAHRGHARLSVRVAEIVSAALQDAGAVAGTFALTQGRVAGEGLVVDPAIKAAGFTGSIEGGRALFNRACTEREDPIPFYGELGSINPVVVTRAAAEERAGALAEGLLASFTMGVGQFCTKPGVVLLPRGSSVPEELAALLSERDGGAMLTPGIHESFETGVQGLDATDGVTLVGRGRATGEGVAPSAFRVPMESFLKNAERLTTECFGPTTLLVEYGQESELDQVLEVLPGSLTVSVHGTESDHATWASRLPRWKKLAGRVVWNGWPTGVAVNNAMQHGGPWPATTGSLHTSVGATAIRRFLRPVAYQNMPEELLPEALRSANPLGIVRRVDGELTR